MKTSVSSNRLSALLYVLTAVILAIEAMGALSGFPVMDDGEILTIVREGGLTAIAPTHRDRPLYGSILHSFVGIFGERTWAWIAMNVFLWAVLAWQSSRLFRRLFPDEDALAGLIALLVVAPMVVEMQYTTLNYAFPAILPVCLALAGILIALRPGAGPNARLSSILLMTILAAAGALVSEYALATLAAGAGLLVMTRRARTVPFLALGGGLGFLGFRWLSDPAARPTTRPALQAAQALSRPLWLPIRWISGMWASLIGAYGSAAGSFALDARSLTTVCAALVAFAFAVVAGIAVRRARNEDSSPRGRELAGLVLAVALGLLPVVLADRRADVSGFESRFRLPVLPFAVAATVHLLFRLTFARWRFVWASLLAAIAGYAAVSGAFQVRRVQREYDSVGRLLLPRARQAGGLSVVVIADPDYSVPLAKLARRWGVEDERRIWALKDDEAVATFGTRGACLPAARLRVPPTLRRVGRDGPISAVLWVERSGGGVRLEPYCAAPVLRGGGP